MIEKKSKSNFDINLLDKTQAEENHNSSTIYTSMNNNIKTKNIDMDYLESNPRHKLKKNNSDYFYNTISNTNINANNNYEETNFRKEISTERYDVENNYRNVPIQTYRNGPKQNMSFSGKFRENSNSNLNTNNHVVNNTFTCSKTNDLKLNSLHSSYNNIEFGSKYRKNYDPNINEIAELESNKNMSMNNTNNNINSNLISPNYNNINLECSPRSNNNVYYESSIANELRISNLEKRLENTEKVLHFYDEMLRLKDEERRNEVRIDKNIIVELTKKVNFLEENIKFLNKKISDQGELFNQKIDLIEKNNLKNLDIKNSVGEYYAEKLAEFENLYKKSEAFFETKIEEKVLEIQNN